MVLQAPRGRDPVLDEPFVGFMGWGAAEIGVKEDPTPQYLPAPGVAAEFTWKQKSQRGR